MTDKSRLIERKKYTICRALIEREMVYLGAKYFTDHISHSFADWTDEQNGSIIMTSISQNNLIFDGKNVSDKSNFYFSTLIKKDEKEWSRLAEILMEKI